MERTLVLLVLCLAAPAASQMLLGSKILESGGELPGKFGCDFFERDVSRPNPAVSWVRPPAKSRSFVLVVDDLDTETVSWVVKNIPSWATEIEEDATETGMPVGSVELKNSYSSTAYAAPCPEADTTQKYRFRLFAMPRAVTDILEPSDNNFTSSFYVDQIQEEALYVAVLNTQFTLVTPDITDWPYDLHVTVRKTQPLEIFAPRTRGCDWVLDSSDQLKLPVKLVTAAVVNETTHARYVFSTPWMGNTYLLYNLTCDDNSVESLVQLSKDIFAPSKNLRPTLVPGVNHLTYRILVTIDPPRPKLDPLKVYLFGGEIKPANTGSSFRFIKPSEVLRRRDGMGMSAKDGVRDCERQTDGDCVVDQVLVSEKVEDIFDCREQTKHATRHPNIPSCQMQVRLEETHCSSFHWPLRSSLDNNNNTNLRGVSPGVVWRNVPKEAKSLLLVVEDASPATGGGRTFWTVLNIPATATGIGAGASGRDWMPPLSIEVGNSFNTSGFYPPSRSSTPMPQPRLRLFAMAHPKSLPTTPSTSNQAATKRALALARQTAICEASLDLPMPTSAEAEKESLKLDSLALSLTPQHTTEEIVGGVVPGEVVVEV